MSAYSLGRADIVQALQAALEPLESALAMWEGGAAAFNRLDEWSDIDLQVAARDEQVEVVVAAAETALQALAPIELRYELPQPTWHGHWQAFYRLAGASPFLMLDFVVMKGSASNRFLEREIHGQAQVYFDKVGFVQAQPLDRAAWQERLRRRVATLQVLFPLFQVLTLKEINRGNFIEALAFYQGYTLRPLVEVLRIHYTPFHHDFHTRYLYYELPPEVVRRLESLFFVADPQALAAKREQAQVWFNQTLSSMNIG
jgi:hypothetical protein